MSAHRWIGAVQPSGRWIGALTGGSATATQYTLSGPTIGIVNVASTNFTVTPNGTVASGTVTPASSGAGTFSPTSLTFTASSTPQTFTYTPTSTSGSPHSISITSSPVLTYVGSPIAYTVNASGATAYTLSASPNPITTGQATTATVTPNGSYTGTITVTPSGTASSGLSAHAFTFSGTSSPQTFNFTPTVVGTLTLTGTNSGGLSNPSAVNVTVNPVITVTSPVTYAMFQRSVSTGSIVIAGQHNDTVNRSISASFNGGSSSVVVGVAVPNTPFTGTLTGQSQGQGDVVVSFTVNSAISTTVNNVGITDVWAIAGQSNASGRFTNNQPMQLSTSPRPFSETYKPGMYGNGGTPNTWLLMADPTGIALDSGSTGSYWPHMINQYVSYWNLPAGIVPCAVGGTSITQWVPQGTGHNDPATLYGAMYLRIMAVGGVKAVLWHQGEQDAAMSAATYQGYMVTLAAAIASDFGCKLIPCKLQTGASYPGPNTAITAEWASDANVLRGPDLSDMGTSLHLTTDGEAEAAGSRWWMALYKAFWQPAGGTGGVVASRIFGGM